MAERKCVLITKLRMSNKNKEILNEEGADSTGDSNKEGHGVKLNVNLVKLGTDSLRRYCKFYNIDNIDSDSSRNKCSMLSAVQQHFASQPPLDEQQVIPNFVDAARRLHKDGKPKDRVIHHAIAGLILLRQIYIYIIYGFWWLTDDLAAVGYLLLFYDVEISKDQNDAGPFLFLPI